MADNPFSSRCTVPPLGPMESAKENVRTGADRRMNQNPGQSKFSTCRQPRVLRSGETVESLFCISAQSPRELKELCRKVVDGPLADDAGTWLRVLELSASTVSPSSSRGKDILRLHRRALSRFAAADLSDPDVSHGLLSIWLSYARSQAKYGAIEEARTTLRRIQSQRLGLKNARFYLAVAEVEFKADQAIAMQALRMGIHQNAEPLDLLTTALHDLECGKGVKSSCRDAGPSMQASNSPLRHRSHVQGGTLPNQIPDWPNEQDVPPKCLIADKSEYELLAPSSLSDGTLSRGFDSEQEESSCGADSLCNESSEIQIVDSENPIDLNRKAATSAKRRWAELDDGQCSEAQQHGNEGNRRVLQRVPLQDKYQLSSQISTAKISLPSRKVTFTSSNEAQSALTPNPLRASEAKLENKVRIDQTSRKPRLTKLGINGKAQRVDQPSLSLQGHEPDLNSSQGQSSVGIQAIFGSENLPSIEANLKVDQCQETSEHANRSIQPPNPKFSRHDLSYILNWDPTAPRQAKSEDPKPRCYPVNDKNEETAPGTDVSGTVISLACSSLRHDLVVSHNNQEVKDIERDTRKQDLKSGNPISDRRDMAAKENADHLSLVAESNILRVNGEPYVLLKTIGSGGSCKVFSAVCKDRSVVAIKRVKLEGIDRKAIDGYANEIALLNRLRGNPSIIHLFDSVVDLARKSIFLVLELGELDLNQAIQQQISRSPKTNLPSALSMNFIRLAWQQMLKAVHSIHEERIIHGDLKPANFVFVRGVLKLIDFGIAKAIQSEDTTNIYRESIIGTLNYLSPEAIMTENTKHRTKVSRASDVWSLGCILYQMVYGKTPFAQLQMIPKLQAIINPDYVIDFPPAADEAALDAIKLCLRRSPIERPPIVGKNGLLTEHKFLHTDHRTQGSSSHCC